MIRDVIAAIGMVGGASLMAVGALGLLRFPDVFTRMHAATKAATVGVIGLTLAASLEASGTGGALTLLIVVALLFLSAPLGMSLLARAAFHDPETPRVATTLERDVDLPASTSIPARSEGRRSRLLAVWLFVVWVAFFGTLTVGVVVSGAVVAGAVAFVFRTFAPRWPRGFLRPVGALRFFVHFVAQLVAATWDVTRTTLSSREQIRPAIVEVPLRATTRNEVALLMNAISFTPGTVALEVHDRRLIVHVLTVEDPSTAIGEIRRMEYMIMAAFGSGIEDGGDVQPKSRKA